MHSLIGSFAKTLDEIRVSRGYAKKVAGLTNTWTKQSSLLPENIKLLRIPWHLMQAFLNLQ